MQPNITPTATNNDPSQFGEYSDWAKGELAAGHSVDDLHQTLQSQGITDYGQPQAAAPQASGNGGGNWFTHLLPTIGGIAGGALGSLTDAFTGPLGTIGGSAGGSALGKGLEDALEGKQAGGDVLGAAAEGGIGAGVGGIIGKGLGLGGKFLAGRAGTITDAAAQDAANAATKNAVTDIATQYKDVAPGLRRAYNLKDGVAHVQGLGFDGAPDSMVAVGNTSNDILNSTLNKALSDAGPVDMSHYTQLIKDALASRSGTLGSYDKVAISAGKYGAPNTAAAKTLGQLEDLGAGVAKTQSDPVAIRDLTTKLYKLAQDAKPTVTAATGAIDPKQKAIYDAINEVRNGVKNSLYNREELNAPLTALKGNLGAGDTLDNQALAEHLNGIVSGAGTKGQPAAQDILDELQRNINISKVGKAGQDVRQDIVSRGGQDRALAENGIPAGQAQAVDPATGAPISMAADVAGAKGIGGKALAVGKHVINNPGILNTLGRIGNMGDKLQVGGKTLPGIATMAGTAIGTSPNLGADPVGISSNGTIGGTMQNQPNGATGAPNSIDLSGILQHYIDMGNAAPSLLPSITPIVQALAPVVQKQQMAASDLSALPGAYANAGGAQGTSGVLSQISALIPGTAAYNYQKQKEAAAQALGNSMGISPSAAGGMLPSLMNNDQTAGMNQGILGNLSGQLR